MNLASMAKRKDKLMRIAGVSESKTGLFNRLVFWMARRRLGKVADPLKALGHHGWVMFGNGMFEMASERARKVEGRLKELAQIKAATLVGCPF